MSLCVPILGSRPGELVLCSFLHGYLSLGLISRTRQRFSTKSILHLTLWAKVGIGMIMEALQQNEPLGLCPNVCGPHTWPWLVTCRRVSSSSSLKHVFGSANAKCFSLVSQGPCFRRSSQIGFFLPVQKQDSLVGKKALDLSMKTLTEITMISSSKNFLSPKTHHFTYNPGNPPDASNGKLETWKGGAFPDTGGCCCGVRLCFSQTLFPAPPSIGALTPAPSSWHWAKC